MKVKLTENLFIEQCAYAPFNWDLYISKEMNIKGEKTIVDKPVCYGLSLDQLLIKVADFEIQLGTEKEIEFKEYIERYERTTKEVINNFKKQKKNGSI